MKLYKLFFYKFYSWAEKLHGNEESSEYTAFFSLTFLIYVNIVTLLLAIKMILNISLTSLELSKFEIGFYSILPAIPQYFLLLHKKRYVKIIREFKKVNKYETNKWTLIMWLYIAGSLLLLFGLVLIQIKINEMR